MLETNYRSHTWGELEITKVGEEVSLCGWVQKKRELGGMTFVDLRDRYGITQLAFNVSWQLLNQVLRGWHKPEKCFHLGWCMRSTKWDKKDSQLSLILIFSIKCGLLSLGQAQPNSILRLFYFSELSRDERYWKIEGWANRFTSAIGPNSPSPSQPQLSPPPPSSLALQHTYRINPIGICNT